MSQSVSATLATATGEPATARAGSGPLFIQGRALDGLGLPSGANIHFTSSDPTVVALTTPRQRGNSPAGAIGLRSGSAVITGVTSDNAAASATLVVTVP